MHDSIKDFGAAVRIACARLDLTQVELANKYSSAITAMPLHRAEGRYDDLPQESEVIYNTKIIKHINCAPLQIDMR